MKFSSIRVLFENCPEGGGQRTIIFHWSYFRLTTKNINQVSMSTSERPRLADTTWVPRHVCKPKTKTYKLVPVQTIWHPQNWREIHFSSLRRVIKYSLSYLLWMEKVDFIYLAYYNTDSNKVRQDLTGKHRHQLTLAVDNVHPSVYYPIKISGGEGVPLNSGEAGTLPKGT